MNKILFIALIFLLPAHLWGQDFDNDLRLVKNKHFYSAGEFSYYQGEGNDQKAFHTAKKNVIAKYNLVTLALKGSMLLYQNILSPQLSRECPYEITCSNFCKESIKEYGILKGVFIGADRIMRCNRISLLDIQPMDINTATGKIYDPPGKYK